MAILALLGEGPRHGYSLKTEFDGRTGGAWPLNVGQVYTTLDRLERDGLVVPVEGGNGSRRWPPRSRSAPGRPDGRLAPPS